MQIQIRILTIQIKNLLLYLLNKIIMRNNKFNPIKFLARKLKEIIGKPLPEKELFLIIRKLSNWKLIFWSRLTPRKLLKFLINYKKFNSNQSKNKKIELQRIYLLLIII